MDQQNKRILLIDDDEDDFILIRGRLRETGNDQYTVEWAPTLQAGRDAMAAIRFDAVLVDYRMGAHTGIELIREAVSGHYPAPILLLTGQGNYEVDLEAMQAGAADYLNKSELNSSLLERSIRYAIERKQHEEALRRSEQALRASESRFRIALSNTAITVFSTDRDLRYTWVYSAMMGSLAEQFIGKRDDEILPAEDAAVLTGLKQKAFEEQTAVQKEIMLRLLDEEKKIVVSIEPFLDPDGKLSGVIGAYYDVTDQRRLEQERVDHQMEMEVQRRLTEYREKERQAIARDLHDGPVQNLSSLIFGVQFVKEAVQDENVRLELENIRTNLRDTVSNLREMMNELRPPSLIRFGLGKAIQFHLENFREKHPELEIDLNIDTQEPHKLLSEQMNLNLFRIYSEAMNNIIYHASATEIKVSLVQVDHQVLLEIRDNGEGFLDADDLSDHTQNNHFGLAVMKERAEMINGEFLISSQSQIGTAVQVRVRLADDPGL
jgi:signal transduction histidine kinase